MLSNTDTSYPKVRKYEVALPKDPEACPPGPSGRVLCVGNGTDGVQAEAEENGEGNRETYRDIQRNH